MCLHQRYLLIHLFPLLLLLQPQQTVSILCVWTLCVIEAENLIASRHIAMATKPFSDKAIDLGNHHTMFKIHLIYCWFYKNHRSKQIFHNMFVLWLVHFYQLYRIFIKSAVDQMSFKLGTVITQINSFVQKTFCCHSNMPWGNQLFSLNYTSLAHSLYTVVLQEI